MSTPTATSTGTEAVASYEYDVFISYATDADYALARNVESFLETFHRLPNPDGVPLKALRVCRDGSDFHVPAHRPGEAARSVIEQYLARCEHLLVLCSRKARASSWVDEEVRWFLQHRGAAFVRVALTEGVAPGGLEHEIFPAALVEAGVHRTIGRDTGRPPSSGRWPCPPTTGSRLRRRRRLPATRPRCAAPPRECGSAPGLVSELFRRWAAAGGRGR